MNGATISRQQTREKRAERTLKSNLQKRPMSKTSLYLVVLAAAVTVTATPGVGGPAAADDADRCANASGDAQITACTRVIASRKVKGRWVAYYNRGIAYHFKSDFDHAIDDYGQAIRLAPEFASAYTARGNAYIYKGDFERAISDFDRAIEMDPEFAAEAYNSRGLAYEYQGNAARAITDFNRAIEIDPKFQLAYRNRGVFNLYSGSLSTALADLTQAGALDPKNAYAALWLEIAGQRSDLPSQIEQASRQVDLTKWPAPIIRLLQGRLTPEAVLAAADDPNAQTKRDQLCEANFHTGALALRQNRKDDAVKLFRLAATHCQKAFIECYAAKMELKALGLHP